MILFAFFFFSFYFFYSFPGGRYGSGISSSGYLSEPEPRGYSDRSATFDSRRRLRGKENDFSTSTMPRKWVVFSFLSCEQNAYLTAYKDHWNESTFSMMIAHCSLVYLFRNGPLKYSSDVYKNQPGRIEDYEPGRSSIADKEAKEVRKNFNYSFCYLIEIFR